MTALAMIAAFSVHVGVAAGAAQMAPHAVDGAQCINGGAPYVYANVQASVKDWVIQLGSSSVGLTWCVDSAHCAMFAAPPTGPAPAPAPVTVAQAGPQSDDCATNPTFCKFNQAQIDMCDFSLYLGDKEVPQNGSVPAMHFQGVKLLQASLKTLAGLGMASAERILVTGVGFGGTAVILNADAIGAQLKTLVPTLKDYRALPADGIHPKHGMVLFQDVGGVDAFSGYLESIFKLSNAGPALSASCIAKHPSDPWMCMYANETMAFVKTPIYLVNQLASIWDTQCDLAGLGTSNILQIQCIPKNRLKQMFKWHICFQYSERCTGDQVTNVVAPFQQQYIDDTQNSGIMSRPGNGAFFHSCHLGSYWNSLYNSKSIWQTIAVGGSSIEQAVNTWWNAPNTAASVFTKDCTWDAKKPGYMCNPTCTGFPPYYASAAEASVVVV